MHEILEQAFNVAFTYRVYFTRDVFARSNALFSNAVAQTIPGPAGAGTVRRRRRGQSGASQPRRARSRTIAQRYSTSLALAGPVMVVPGGEQPEERSSRGERILDAIHEAALCRHSYVAAVGGGAVLDVVGYAAATVHRGVRLIRLPTTVLAQDDSGVGVKNGVNAYGQKNYLGTFAPPFAVINDFSFLTTLSDRDWRGGRVGSREGRAHQGPRFLRLHRAARRCAGRP